MKYTALIIEDEKPAATRLEQMLLSLNEDIEVVGNVDSVSTTIQWLEAHPHPDLLLVDIQLGDGLSFNIFKTIETKAWIIFTTAYDQYAMRAFEVNSIDYLLKPIKEEKLRSSIKKFKSLEQKDNQLDIQHLIASISNEKKDYKERFIVNLGSRIRSLSVDEIIAFYVMEKNTFAFTNEGRSFPIDFSLDRIEEMVNPKYFFRINRQTIVNIKGISKIHVLSKSRIKLESDPPCEVELLVSSKKSHAFRLFLDQ